LTLTAAAATTAAFACSLSGQPVEYCHRSCSSCSCCRRSRGQRATRCGGWGGEGLICVHLHALRDRLGKDATAGWQGLCGAAAACCCCCCSSCCGRLRAGKSRSSCSCASPAWSFASWMPAFLLYEGMLARAPSAAWRAAMGFPRPPASEEGGSRVRSTEPHASRPSTQAWKARRARRTESVGVGWPLDMSIDAASRRVTERAAQTPALSLGPIRTLPAAACSADEGGSGAPTGSGVCGAGRAGRAQDTEGCEQAAAAAAVRRCAGGAGAAVLFEQGAREVRPHEGVRSHVQGQQAQQIAKRVVRPGQPTAPRTGEHCTRCADEVWEAGHWHRHGSARNVRSGRRRDAHINAVSICRPAAAERIFRATARCEGHPSTQLVNDKVAEAFERCLKQPRSHAPLKLLK